MKKLGKKFISGLLMATMMMVALPANDVLAGNLYSDETGVKVSLTSEGVKNGTSKIFTLSEADKKALASYGCGDEFMLASKEDLFYFDSADSTADLSSVEEVYISVNNFSRDANGNLVGDGGETVGYVFWDNGVETVDAFQNYVTKEYENQPIRYDKKFHWQSYMQYYGQGKNSFFLVQMVDKDGSRTRYGITFDADLFSYANMQTSVSAMTSSWASDSKGWWIQNSDGTYLTNSWYHDTDGKWYYMGSDGYMLTNTTTPDGYIVNAAGVWVQ